MYALSTIKGTHRFTRAFIIISPLFRDYMESHRFPACENHCLYCGALSPPPPPFHLYTRLLLSRILSPYGPDKCNFLFTNLRSALDSKLSLLLGVYLFIYLSTPIFSRSESSRREFSRLKFYRNDARGELEFQIESYCAKDAPFSAVNCIPVVCASTKL